MYQEDQILEKTKWVDTIIAVACAFIITIIGALLMRWCEARFSAAQAQSASPSQSASETLTNVSAYLYDGFITRDSTLAQAALSQTRPSLSITRTTIIKTPLINRLLGIATAQAAEAPTYSAELVSQTNDRIRLTPGKSFTFTADFLNNGTATWTNNGGHFVALNVSQPAGRVSPFQHAFWTEYYYRPARLSQTRVQPGETGRFTFALHAPDQPGTYTEHFGLVAENLQWITGGDLTITIVVSQPYQAKLTKVMADTISLAPGRSLTYWAEFKNIGSATWTKQGEHYLALNVSRPAGRVSPFQHAFWTEHYYRPARLLQDEVRPGETGRFVFALQAPNQAGQYVEHFGLVAENLTWIAGGDLRLPITVGNPTGGASLGPQPSIRVGITADLNPVVITADGGYRIKTSAGTVLAELTDGEKATVRFADNQYTVHFRNTTKRTSSAIRFSPRRGTILEVENFTNRPGWNTELNDNRFRGSIEIRYAAATGRLWVINDLSFESYLRGIAETSNASPLEFRQALMIAARSYAYYHIRAGTKHRAEHFTVDATYDQVYRGYNFELRASKVVQAVEATRGQIVTYNDEPVITPYFSHSDGRTRSWEEVWAGDPKPWLVSVPDPWCSGQDLFGHGVGMSALGAIGLADEGKTAAEILAYYYTGTGVKKLY